VWFSHPRARNRALNIDGFGAFDIFGVMILDAGLWSSSLGVRIASMRMIEATLLRESA